MIAQPHVCCRLVLTAMNSPYFSQLARLPAQFMGPSLPMNGSNAANGENTWYHGRSAKNSNWVMSKVIKQCWWLYTQLGEWDKHCVFLVIEWDKHCVFLVIEWDKHCVFLVIKWFSAKFAYVQYACGRFSAF